MLVLRIIEPLLAGLVDQVQVREDEEIAHIYLVQRLLKAQVWAENCQSYYVDQNTGWNHSISPFSSSRVWLMTAYPDMRMWKYQVHLSACSNKVEIADIVLCQRGTTVCGRFASLKLMTCSELFFIKCRLRRRWYSANERHISARTPDDAMVILTHAFNVHN
jgi:hypothetical protein